MYTQPVGYYINAAKIMLYVAREDMKQGIYPKDAIIHSVKALNKQKEDLRFSEIFDEIDNTISLMYEYSKKEGYIEQNVGFDDFLILCNYSNAPPKIH